jgi:hypothetical protein
MNQRTYTLNGTNRQALDMQLSEALGLAYGGFAEHVTPDGVVVTVNLDSAPTQAVVNQLNSVMANHDPAVLTPRQEAEQRRQEKLEDLRSGISTDLDPADYSGENALIQTLAERIAWLEQEVIALGGGGDVRQ